MPQIAISLDGGRTFVAAPQGVLVVVSPVAVGGMQEAADLNIKMDGRGMVTSLNLYDIDPDVGDVAQRFKAYSQVISEMAPVAA